MSSVCGWVTERGGVVVMANPIICKVMLPVGVETLLHSKALGCPPRPVGALESPC